MCFLLLGNFGPVCLSICGNFSHSGAFTTCQLHVRSPGTHVFCEPIPIDFDSSNWNFQMNLSQCLSAQSVPNCLIVFMCCSYPNIFHRELLPVNEGPLTASHITENLVTFEEWLRKWRIIVNEDKSAHITFWFYLTNCSAVSLNNKIIPQTY